MVSRSFWDPELLVIPVCKRPSRRLLGGKMKVGFARFFLWMNKTVFGG
jgi:hypothetical protein